jgi:hypothetical protein
MAFLIGADSVINNSRQLDIRGLDSDSAITIKNGLNVYPASPVLLHTIINPNAYSTPTNDFFGYSSAISGNRFIVGAHGEDDAGTGGTNRGKAYIYSVSTGALLHTLNNPNPNTTQNDDFFGYAVAISGNFAIVGAYQEEAAGATVSGYDAGVAYIFNVTTGALVHTLYNPNAYSSALDDHFGISVAIDGLYAAVGATGEDDVDGTSSGKVYVYNVITGALIRTIDNPNSKGNAATTLHSFGSKIAILEASNAIYIGAPGVTSSGVANSGIAYSFQLANGSLNGYTASPSPSVSAYFGTDVKLTAGKYIIGTRSDNAAGGFVSVNGIQVDNPNAFSSASADRFGYRVAISDRFFAASALLEDDSSGANSGKVYVFNTTDRSLLYTIDNPNPGANYWFGQSLDLAGNFLIIGSNESFDGTLTPSSGAIYVYSLVDLDSYVTKGELSLFLK